MFKRIPSSILLKGWMRCYKLLCLLSDIFQAVYRILRAVMEGHLKASIGNIRVMCCMEDCPNRLFSVWTSSILALEKEKDADIDAEGFENAAYYTYS